MVPEPSVVSMCFNPFPVNDSVNCLIKTLMSIFVMIFLLLKLAVYHQARLKNFQNSLKNHFLFFIWTLEIWRNFFKTTIYLYILSTSISAILLKSIPKDPCFEDQTSNLRADRVKASIEKYKDHLSIICIKDKISSINNPKFIFNFVSFEQALDEINRLNSKKTFQTTDIPVPVIKRSKDVMALFIHHNFNNSLSSSSFPTGLKHDYVRPIVKRMTKLIRKTKDQLAFSQT